MPWNKDGSRKTSTFYKMKGTPMQRNFGIGSPVKHGVKDPDTGKTGYRHPELHKGMSLSERLGLTTKPTKVEKDIKEVGKDIQKKSGQVKEFTEKVTTKVAGDVSKVKKKIEKGTKKVVSKVVSDVKDLKKYIKPSSDDYKKNKKPGESRYQYNVRTSRKKKKRTKTAAHETTHKEIK